MLFFRRRSQPETVLDKARSRAADAYGAVAPGAVETVGRAAGAAGHAAERAAVLAQHAREAATPRVRSAAQSSAETLSHAAERAAAVLADTAEKLAQASSEQVGRVRPRKRGRKLKKFLLLGSLVGAAVAAVLSPAGQQLRRRLTGAPDPEAEPQAETITLPINQDQKPSSAATGSEHHAADGNGVLSSPQPETAGGEG
jgi:hypothetical protein